MDSPTQNWLRQNIRQYHHQDRLFADVDGALNRFQTIRLKSAVYTYDDGREQLMICVHGLLPINFRSASYNIPIAIWLTTEYAREPPITYVVPTSDMLVKAGRFIDVSGRCSLQYLADWERKSEGCNLVALLEAMQDQFSREPPVYAKPKEPATPVSLPPSNVHAHGHPPPVQASPSTSMTPNPPNLPPKPDSFGPPTFQTPIPPLMAHPSGVPFVSSPSPPQSIPSQDIHQSAVRPAPPVYPFMLGLPHNGSLNPPPPPPPPPITAPAQAFPIANVRAPIPNFLDEEPEVASPLQTSSPPPPPRPPNPELLQLHAQVHQKLTSELASLAQALALDAERLRAQQADLLLGEPAIRDEMARLEAVKSVCRNVADRFRQTVDHAEKNVTELRRKGDPEVDELVCSTSIVHNQLINLVAEDNAIEDTIYHLHRALNAGRIDLERFLRTARVLAEEQFMKRALIEKIQTGVPIEMSSSGNWA